MIVGYTTGVYDLLHVGHLNLLKRAKSMCDRLIVGVSTDELVQKHKAKTPVQSLEHRMAIVAALKDVDAVVPQDEIDKFKAHKRLKFDVLFVGDDWLESATWNKFEKVAKTLDVKIIYLPYTSEISTTALRARLA